jgi:hypothetical protein
MPPVEKNKLKQAEADYKEIQSEKKNIKMTVPGIGHKSLGFGCTHPTLFLNLNRSSKANVIKNTHPNIHRKPKNGLEERYPITTTLNVDTPMLIKLIIEDALALSSIALDAI